MIDGKSLMKIRRSRGPNMLPSGTAEITGRETDYCLQNTMGSVV